METIFNPPADLTGWDIDPFVGLVHRISTQGTLPCRVVSHDNDLKGEFPKNIDIGVGLIEIPLYFDFLCEQASKRARAREVICNELSTNRATFDSVEQVVSHQIGLHISRADFKTAYMYCLGDFDYCTREDVSDTFLGLEFCEETQIVNFLSNVSLLSELKEYLREILLENEYLLKSGIFSTLEDGIMRENVCRFFRQSFVEAIFISARVVVGIECGQEHFLERYKSKYGKPGTDPILADEMILDLFAMLTNKPVGKYKRSQLKTIESRSRLSDLLFDVHFVALSTLNSPAKTVICWKCNREISRTRCVRCSNCAGATFCSTACFESDFERHPTACLKAIEVADFSLNIEPRMIVDDHFAGEDNLLNRRVFAATGLSLQALISELGDNGMDMIYKWHTSCSPQFVKVASLIGKEDHIMHIQEYLWRAPTNISSGQCRPLSSLSRNLWGPKCQTWSKESLFFTSEEKFKNICYASETFSSLSLWNRLHLFHEVESFLDQMSVIVEKEFAETFFFSWYVIFTLRLCEFAQYSVQLGLYRNRDGSVPNVRTNSFLQNIMKRKQMTIEYIQRALAFRTHNTVSLEELIDVFSGVEYTLEPFDIEESVSISSSSFLDQREIDLIDGNSSEHESSVKEEIEVLNDSSNTPTRPETNGNSVNYNVNEWVSPQHTTSLRLNAKPARRRKQRQVFGSIRGSEYTVEECQVIPCRAIVESQISQYKHKVPEHMEKLGGKQASVQPFATANMASDDLYDAEFDVATLVVPKKAEDIPELEPHCPSCFHPWSLFEAIKMAIVLPCGHAVCTECLVKMEKANFEECVYEYVWDNTEGRGTYPTYSEYNVQFNCPECRQPAPHYALGQLYEYYLEVYLKQHQRLFIKQKIFPTVDDVNSFLTELLQEYDFDLSKIHDIVMEYIAAFDHGRVRDLSHEEKQEIFVDAQAPIEELKKAKSKLEHNIEVMELKGKVMTGRYERSVQELMRVRDRLQRMYESAYDDIFERINTGSSNMGVMKPGKGDQLDELQIDLHGMTVKHGVRKLNELVLPIIPTIGRVVVVTGRGLHSEEEGESPLKRSVWKYAEENGLIASEVKHNPGAVRLQVMKRN
eukprot:Nk52_evm5s237 gene=Nk52_evmTU5s237